MRLALLPLLFLFAVATAHPLNEDNRAALNRNFDVKAGQKALIKSEGLSINFREVAEDSRCPENVKCIWAGNAKVALVLSKTGQPAETVNLNTGLDPKQISYQGYDIKLVDVSPHRKTDAPVSQKDYAVTLLVTKK